MEKQSLLRRLLREAAQTEDEDNEKESSCKRKEKYGDMERRIEERQRIKEEAVRLGVSEDWLIQAKMDDKINRDLGLEPPDTDDPDEYENIMKERRYLHFKTDADGSWAEYEKLEREYREKEWNSNSENEKTVAILYRIISEIREGNSTQEQRDWLRTFIEHYDNVFIYNDAMEVLKPYGYVFDGNPYRRPMEHTEPYSPWKKENAEIPTGRLPEKTERKKSLIQSVRDRFVTSKQRRL